VHRERTVVPGDPREPVGDKAREWVERWNQYSHFLERGSFSHLTRNPIGGGFDFGLNAGVFLDIDGVIRSCTPRSIRIGKDNGWLKKVRSDQVTLGSANSGRRSRTEYGTNFLAEKRLQAVKIALSRRTCSKQPDHYLWDCSEKARLRCGDVASDKCKCRAPERPSLWPVIECDCCFDVHVLDRP
jgi:hypothetical protein